MPTDNYDKQKPITRTKTDLGRRLPSQTNSPGSDGGCHDFIRFYRNIAQD